MNNKIPQEIEEKDCRSKLFLSEKHTKDIGECNSPPSLHNKIPQEIRDEVSQMTKTPQQIRNEVEKEIKDNKFILDACCGAKMFWFQKEQPNTIFIDNREEQRGFQTYRPNRRIKPDFIMDNRKMDFPDKKFKLVVFDPPHLFSGGLTCRLLRDYGMLNKDTWKEDIKKGFDECWRVLDDYGVLIFKWCAFSVKIGDILKVIDKTPLFGHKTVRKNNTFWFCFMKIPEKELLPKIGDNSEVKK